MDNYGIDHKTIRLIVSQHTVLLIIFNTPLAYSFAILLKNKITSFKLQTDH